MPRIVRHEGNARLTPVKKQRRTGENRAKSAFQNECQHALSTMILNLFDGVVHPMLFAK